MIRSHHLAATATLTLALLAPGDAAGFQQPDHLTGAGLELASGGHARLVGTVSTTRPRGAQRQWQLFGADVGGHWTAIWDEATGVPRRIMGTGIAAPQANPSETAAADFADDFLNRHLALLAPGATPTDFVLVSNVQHRGLRTVAYQQHHRGLLVLGGQVSFRFKNDRLMLIASEAIPMVAATAPTTSIAPKEAQSRAETWLSTGAATAATAAGVQGPFILPIVAPAQVVSTPVVLRVTVETTGPLGRWAVYLDASTGRPVAREQTLRFAEGAVLYNAPVRYPLSDRQDYPAKLASLTVAGSLTSTDDDGMVTFADGGPVSVLTKSQGTGVYVTSDTGPDAQATFSLEPGGSITWNAATEPLIDAQLSAFIHARAAKDFAAELAPTMSWLNSTLSVNVNINDSCNAYYNGSSINFLRASQQCENTARLADVVYHEFGHGFHHHSIILGAGQFEPALSEGLSDYLAATITGDPKTAPGFYYSAAPLRDIDPDNGEFEWPFDIHYDPHQTGLIISGALWDLRKLLVTEHGPEAGAALTNQLYAQAIQTAADIPSMYAEILAADDDDGNLENGTPNVCEIIEAFARHGLRFASAEVTPLAVEPPAATGYEVAVTVAGLFDQCPGDVIESAKIRWRLRRNPNQLDTVTMEGGPAEFTGLIPEQTEGDVILYRVDLGLAIGATQSFPENPADPMYEFFAGEVVEIYCADFETDPFIDGWTHGLLSSSYGEQVDDWEWGPPLGTERNGDPTEAYSGVNVVGTDLGHDSQDGFYLPKAVSYLDSPRIDVSEANDPRLHYQRWLQVEDGHFDTARIYVNGEPLWESYGSPSEPATTHHTDREWRFQDIDLRPYIDADGTVQIRFELEADSNNIQRGGWTLDDVCIVDFLGAIPGTHECGNGTLEMGEQCDDGNVLAGDGCGSHCMIEAEPEVEPPPSPPAEDGGCGCRLVGPPGQGRWTLLGLLVVGALARRWRR